MRDTTERPEALEAGTVKLVSTDYDKIIAEVSALLDDNDYYERMSQLLILMEMVVPVVELLES